MDETASSHPTPAPIPPPWSLPGAPPVPPSAWPPLAPTAQPALPARSPATPRRWARRVVGGAAIVAISLAAGGAGGWIARQGADSSGGSTLTIEHTSMRLSGTALDVAAVLDALRSSVVSVDTTTRVSRGPFVSEGQGAGTGIVLDVAASGGGVEVSNIGFAISVGTATGVVDRLLGTTS